MNNHSSRFDAGSRMHLAEQGCEAEAHRLCFSTRGRSRRNPSIYCPEVIQLVKKKVEETTPSSGWELIVTLSQDSTSLLY